MRRINSLLTAVILILFLLHGIAGAYQLMGILTGGNPYLKICSWVLAALVAVHAILSIILTFQSLQSIRQSGASYWRENKLFWLRRISGLILFALILQHILFFWFRGTGAFRLRFFGVPQMAFSGCLVLVLLIHLLSNLHPLALGLGWTKGLSRWRDGLILLGFLLLGMAVSFLIYYWRWNRWW